MKKYGKVATVGLFVILGVFVLLQYQNCGNSSGTTNTSAVGPSGLTYTVTLTPSSTTINRNVQMNMSVRVQSSGLELTSAVIGYFNGSNKQELCKVSSQVPSTDYTNNSCEPSFSQDGTISLYVDILDPNFPPTEYMIDCSAASGQLPAGCAGTYAITVQN